jgi:fructose-1,6-bisphosphatase I
MNDAIALDAFLRRWSGTDRDRAQVAEAVSAIADACQAISRLIAAGALAGALGATRGDHGGGDIQKELDVLANDLLIERLRHAPVASMASEEAETPELLDSRAPLLVAVDPLDGSSNIDTNVSVGTIFSVLPGARECLPGDAEAFLQSTRSMARKPHSC